MPFPEVMVRLTGAHIDGSDASCLGGQLAAVVRALEATLGPTIWYASDVEATPASELPAGAQPIACGRTSALIARLEATDQVLAGVFLAVPHDAPVPRLRDVARTDDPPFAELGDAVAEVRAFDTSWVEVYARSADLIAPLQARYACEARARA